MIIWPDTEGNYLDCSFNIVKNTQITDHLVSFEDLILDIMVLTSGEYFILGEDELHKLLGNLENGYVKEALHTVSNTIQELLPKIIIETATIFKNGMKKK